MPGQVEIEQTPASPPPRSVRSRALDAQGELLPYAIGFFAVALPIFVWAGAYANDAVWMSAIFVQFSLNWAAFYAVVNRLGRRGAAPLAEAARTRLHVAGGLLWALATAEIAVFAFNAGPVREVLLAMDVAAVVACFFFASPLWKTLGAVGPVAAAGPLAGFYLVGDKPSTAAAAGALALAMALCLVLNRILGRQFALAAEREALMAERASSLDMAERLATSKSQILATLSQEIRSGLTGVTHVLAAAASGGRTAPSREQLNAALGAANDLLEVLNATLDNETASTGQLVLARRPFDPAALARSQALLGRPKAAAKGLELHVHVDDGLGGGRGAALGDPARVRQILANLIGNAVKYTARGRVEVRVLASAPDRIRYEVADTGPGLSPEELERAFQPFSRIERVGLGLPGAGLGLSLSRELARLMGGEVSAESAVGVGSRFWFDVPFDGAAVAEDEPGAEEPSQAGAPLAPQALKVLIADTDALGAAMLRSIVEQLGHQVVHAHDSRRALELAEVCQFDLIFLDGRLPLLSGEGGHAHVSALAEASRGARILAVISGDADEVQACAEAGIERIVRKPASVASVARAVAAAMDGRGSAPRRKGQAA
jgi:signal transduction histidine kinase/ActR/RegA family two-component response regulator